MKPLKWKLNISNPGKFEEFKRLFGQHRYSLEASHFDLPEIEADVIKVVSNKIS